MVKKVILLVVGMLAAAGLVFGGLVLFSEKLDYAGAEAYAEDMLAMEESVMQFLEAEATEFDKDTEELTVRFIELTGRMNEYYKSLGASSALKNDEVRARYDGLAEGLTSLGEVRNAAKWLLSLIKAAATDSYAEVLADVKVKASNDFMVQMAEDMADYLEKARLFTEKYAGGKAENYNVMTEEYGVILAEGEALKKKYSEVALKDVVGVSAETIKGWFSDLKELRGVLEEKK